VRLTNFGRRCEVSIRTWQKQKDTKDKKAVDTMEHGIFHQWGMNVVNKSQQQPVMQTVGIVELETGTSKGKVVRILPEYIKFLEPLKEFCPT